MLISGEGNTQVLINWLHSRTVYCITALHNIQQIVILSKYLSELMNK